MARNHKSGGAPRRRADDSPLITVEEAAAYLGVSRNTAYTEAKEGNLPVHRIRKRIFIVKPLLEEMITGRRSKKSRED